MVGGQLDCDVDRCGTAPGYRLGAYLAREGDHRGAGGGRGGAEPFVSGDHHGPPRRVGSAVRGRPRVPRAGPASDEAGIQRRRRYGWSLACSPAMPRTWPNATDSGPQAVVRMLRHQHSRPVCHAPHCLPVVSRPVERRDLPLSTASTRHGDLCPSGVTIWLLLHCHCVVAARSAVVGRCRERSPMPAMSCCERNPG